MSTVMAFRKLRVAAVAAGLLSSISTAGTAAEAQDKSSGYAFNVIAENAPDPLGTEPEAIEVNKRAAHRLAMKWGIMFVYDDRCAPRVPGSEEEARLKKYGKPIPETLPAPRPMRVFDDLYYVGLDDVAAWALVQKGGQEIYLFDALNNADEAERYIAGGLKTLGFDPANIKSVFIMHGHFDHYGGARFLQEKYGATVYLGDADWGDVLRQGADPKNRGFGLAPSFDQILKPGKMLLGDTEVTFLETPGHTNGTVSALLPVTFKREKHLAAFWGGTGYPRGDDRQLDKYIRSLTDFTAQVRRAGADVFLSNHSHSDASVQRFATINWDTGKSDMVWGPDYVVDLLDVLNFCARAQYERQIRSDWPF
ncbi:MBL fold metallo-hydrolase [Ensifer aridi]|uniref:MBL fold metallo-hydrolase n=1 Tax=Ensifer aridi TaxID=1708715 RepID=UPI000A110F4E|nr:MBL fold metallo-hydrolase [Ensifer aridi]